MSCFPEATYAVYIDGELPADRQRAVEAHLVGCRDCRARIVALRDEAELLSDVLRERASAPLTPVHRPAPARGLALGLVPALLLATVAAAVLGALLQAQLPGSIVNPLRLRGVSSMAFDLLFILRDRVPGLLGLAVAVAATTIVSALLTYGVSAVSRRWTGPGLMALLCFAALATPSPSAAHFGLHEHRDIRVAADEVHQGTLAAWTGRTVNVDGVIDGDLIVMGERLAVRGEVRGNIVACVRDVDVSGVVTGSIYLLSGYASVSGSVERNLYAIAEDMRLVAGGRVGHDLLALASTAVVEGGVGRDVFGGVDWMEVRGDVGRNLHVYGDRLALLDGARIGGDVDAALPAGREIELAAGARVAGETETRVDTHLHPPILDRYGEAGFWIWIAVEFAGAFLFGLLLHALLPGVFGGRLETAGAFFRSVGVGLLAVLVAPLALALCGATLVGLPIALVGLGLLLTALYVAFLVVAALVGTALVRSRAGAAPAFGVVLLSGLAVVLVACHLPFVGRLLTGLFVLAGLGLLVERGRDALRAARRAPA